MQTLRFATAVMAISLSSADMTWASNPYTDWDDKNLSSLGSPSAQTSTTGCSFRYHDAGTIERRGMDWVTTRMSTIQVRSQGSSSIVMTSDNVLRLASNNSDTGITATVDYTNGGRATQVHTRTGGTTSINNNSLSVRGATNTTPQISLFYVGGSATMSVDGQSGHQAVLDKLANNTEYSINHTLTCTQ